MSEQQAFGKESAPTEALVYYRPIKADTRRIPEPEATRIPQAAEVDELLTNIKEDTKVSNQFRRISIDIV